MKNSVQLLQELKALTEKKGLIAALNALRHPKAIFSTN
jgi:hypothetical protein